MIFDTISAMADAINGKYGDLTLEEVTSLLLSLKEEGRLNITYENLTIGGDKKSVPTLHIIKHFIFGCSKRNGNQVIQPLADEEVDYRTRRWAQGITQVESAGLSSSSSSSMSSSSYSSSSYSSSSSSYSSSSSQASEPPMEVTVTWIDDDETKSILGLSWTNGETKWVMPQTHESFDSYEVWTVSTGTGVKERLSLGHYYHYSHANNYSNDAFIRLRIVELDSNTYTFNYSPRTLLGEDYNRIFNSTGLLNYSLQSTFDAFAGVVPFGISDGFNGSITTSGGLTLSWSRVKSDHWSVPIL